MGLKRIALIANPNAGRRDSTGLRDAIELLRRHVPTDFLETGHPHHATELAARHGQDPETLVAGCGGDGTIVEIINGLPPHGLLGVLPGGTANVVARELGIPLNLREAAKILLTGAEKRLDVGRVSWCSSTAGENRQGQTRYLMVAGFGLDAHVAGHVPRFAKKFIGQYAYHLEVMKRFFSYSPSDIAVEVEGGKTFSGKFLLLANMRRYGGNLFFAHDARYDDGLLDMVLFKRLSFSVMLKSTMAAKMRHGVPESLAYRLRGKTFRVTFDRPTPFQLDGEVFPEISEAVVEALPASVRMIIP